MNPIKCPKKNKDQLIKIRWRSMVSRCENESDKDYAGYGGRGISVSDSWKDFRNFLNDMGMPPFDGASIDRINNKLGYSKANCRWATREQQCSNQSKTRLIYAFGETKSLSEWSKDPRCSVGYFGLMSRLNKGAKPETAISKPTQRPHTKKQYHRKKYER